jgi:hypothetical protein
LQLSTLHHRDDSRAIPANVFSIAGDIRNREQVQKLSQDLVLVRAAVVAHRAGGWVGRLSYPPV